MPLGLGAKGSSQVDDAIDILKPRPYQEEDIQFHLANPRSANHNQPGMGKTFTAAETLHRANTKKNIVIVPNYVVEQWATFLRRQYPNDHVIVARGSKQDRIDTLMQSVLFSETQVLWLVMNKEMLRTFPIIPIYDGVIMDESHHFANRDAKMTKEALKLAESPNVKYLIQLTATPIRKEPDDLWAQLHMLDPQGQIDPTAANYYKFVSRYCFAEHGRFGLKIRGGRTKDIKEMLLKYAKSHTYNQVRLQLPRLIEYNDTLEMTPTERKAYDAVRIYWQIQAHDSHWNFDEPKYMTNAMQVMSFLRRMTMCQSKLEAIQDIIEDAPSDEAIVIYAWYKDNAEKIASYLLDNSTVSTDIPIITGDVPANDRAAIARGQKYVIATLASLSEGVDLSHARTVVFAEEYWQPAMMFQALSRVRRWSNDSSPVKAHYLQMESTIDEIVHDAQRNRHETIGQIMKKALED